MLASWLRESEDGTRLATMYVEPRTGDSTSVIPLPALPAALGNDHAGHGALPDVLISTATGTGTGTGLETGTPTGTSLSASAVAAAGVGASASAGAPAAGGGTGGIAPARSHEASCTTGAVMCHPGAANLLSTDVNSDDKKASTTIMNNAEANSEAAESSCVTPKSSSAGIGAMSLAHTTPESFGCASWAAAAAMARSAAAAAATAAANSDVAKVVKVAGAGWQRAVADMHGPPANDMTQLEGDRRELFCDAEVCDRVSAGMRVARGNTKIGADEIEPDSFYLS